MAALDVLAVPSLTTPTWTEQFGRVVVEGMFAGTAIVVADSGALPEVVGPAGQVVEEGNVDALAGALEEALANREAWSDRARQWGVSQYHPSVLAQKAVALWAAVGNGG
jgi:glycosyltransferase involved in cell wall biosynthesis